MSHTADTPSFAQGAVQHAAALRLWPTLVIALAAVFAISLPNLIDPMVRFDDYPALFADAPAYYQKTLDEGRWLNYWWHLRGVVTPAWLNFALYQMLWAAVAACLACAALGRHGSGWFTAVLALAILVAPSATLISLWFNTLLPGLALVALYAWLGCVLPPRRHRLLLPPFVVISFLAYTMYPVLLLAICLARSETRTLRDLVGLLSLFTASFAVAVLTVYTINYQVHGVFGVPVAEWRNATPAADLNGLVANLPLIAESLADLMAHISYGFAPAAYFHLMMLGLGTAVLLRHAPREALYLHAGLWTGMALIVVQILKIGLVVPPRAFLFAWVFYAILIVRAAQILTDQGGVQGRIARNLVLLVVGSYLLQTFQQYASYRGWQADTRALADVVAATDGPVALSGDVLALPSAQAAYVQDNRALAFRLQHLTGRVIPHCAEDPGACCEGQAAAQPCPMMIRIIPEGPGARIALDPASPQP